MIAIDRSAAADAAYGVLAYLDLPRDAANLHDATLDGTDAPWRDGLAQAYRDDPARLVVQFAGLSPWPDVASLVDALRGDRVEIGGLHPGAALASAFGDAIEHWWLRHEHAWHADAHAHAARAESARAHVLPPLTDLRAALWERRGPAPALRILDVDALGIHGRGRTLPDATRLVATSLAGDPDDVLVRILHEEVHAITDPLLRLDRRPGRDTRADDPGFARHRALEHAAVEVGAAVIDSRAPSLRPAYDRWRRRFGM